MFYLFSYGAGYYLFSYSAGCGPGRYMSGRKKIYALAAPARGAD